MMVWPWLDIMMKVTDNRSTAHQLMLKQNLCNKHLHSMCIIWKEPKPQIGSNDTPQISCIIDCKQLCVYKYSDQTFQPSVTAVLRGGKEMSVSLSAKYVPGICNFHLAVMP